MRKAGLVLSLLAASTSAAWAQNSVTVYGIVDGGVMHLTGMRGGSTTRLVSGVMDGSRFGLRGSEDLGGGYKAIFTLENRTEIDTGGTYNRPFSGDQVPDRIATASALGLSPLLQPLVDSAAAAIGATIGVNSPGSSADAPRFWDRQAYVGLITPIGAVVAGRQYTPAYEVNAAFDIMNTQSALSAGQVATLPQAVDIRLSNTLQYRIQAAGVTASLMYGFGESPDGVDSKNQFMGGMVMYKAEAFSAGVGYNQRNNELGDSSLRTLTVGALVNFGTNTISALYGKVKDDNPSGLSQLRTALVTASPAFGATVADAFVRALRQDGDLMHIGYRTTFGPNTVYVASSFYDDKQAADADVLSYGVGYSYAFSKRTDVNVILARFDNGDNGQTAPGQAGMVGGVTATAGADSTSFTVGLRHRF